MKAVAAVAGLSALAFALGLIDYRAAQQIGTALGPAPFVLGIPPAFVRARRGDRAALYVLIGWSVYAFGIFTMAALLRGLVDANVFTQNAFQIGAVLEMVMWMRVLGYRMEETRQAAEQAEKERETLRSLAHTDPLTGLPNRRGLELAVTAALAEAHVHQWLAVYLLDLDGFKAVNDRLGHEGGDALLREVARRLRACLRGKDVVARLGGDEFVVLASGLPDLSAATHVGEKLVAALDPPFDVAGETCRVGLTVGFALAPDEGANAATLLKRADEAMYAGKLAGKHCVRRWSRPGTESFGDRVPGRPKAA